MEVTDKNISYVRKNASILQKKLKDKGSMTETHFAHLLDKAGIYYVREKANYQIGTRWCYYDFFIPGCSLYIELDGREHEIPAQKSVDHEKEEIVRNKFLRIVRFTNHEILSLDSITLYYIASRITTRGDIRNVKEWSIKRRVRFHNAKQRAIQKFGEFICEMPVYLYNRESDKFYEFGSIYEAHNATGVAIDKIAGRTEIDTHKCIKYIWAKTKEECIESAIAVYGDRQIETDFLKVCSMIELLHSITKMEKIRKQNGLKKTTSPNKPGTVQT